MGLPTKYRIYNTQLLNFLKYWLHRPIHRTFNKLLKPHTPAAWIVSNLCQNFRNFNDIQPQNLPPVVIDFVNSTIKVKQGLVEHFQVLVGQLLMQLLVLDTHIKGRWSVNLQNVDFVLSELQSDFLVELLNLPL